MRLTASESCAARRPHKNALLLKSTATPFNSMARSMASSVSGTNPCCQAKPTRKRLAAMESPSSAVAIFVALIKVSLPSAVASAMARRMAEDGNSRSGLATNPAVMDS